MFLHLVRKVTGEFNRYFYGASYVESLYARINFANDHDAGGSEMASTRVADCEADFDEAPRCFANQPLRL
jgi:hypothetical protein